MISSLPTITEAVAAICQGRMDPRDLVTQCLEQIHRRDDGLHAWVCTDDQRALAAADDIVKRLHDGRPVGCLPGIPIAIKDIIDVRHLPTRAGSSWREAAPSVCDALLVGRLRQQGAIVLGKTVTTEFACFDPPDTVNPWNPDRTPGGSSSGSAVAVAAGMCLGAVGTQTGGSLIRPASYCGIASLKPTHGVVSLEGVIPISSVLDHAGPMARTVDDLARLLLAMAEPEHVDELCRQARRWLGDRANMEASAQAADQPWVTVKELLVERPLLRLIDGAFTQRMDSAVRSLAEHVWEQLGVDANEAITLPEPLDEVNAHHRIIMATDLARYHRRSFATHRDAYGPKIASLIEEGLAVSEDEYHEALDHRERFRESLRPLFTERAVWVMGATPTTAPTRETTGDPVFNSLWSYAGLPVVTVPAGLAPDGLPWGIQLIGPDFTDLPLLAAACWCEQQLAFEHQPP